MDNGVERNCWGVTMRALLGFGAIMLVVWLIGNTQQTKLSQAEPASFVAAN